MSRYNRQLILIYNHRWFIYLPSFGGVEDHQFKYDYLNNSSTWMILVSSDFENYSNIKYTSCLQSRKACACWNTHGNMKYLKISSDNSIGPQWWFTKIFIVFSVRIIAKRSLDTGIHLILDKARARYLNYAQSWLHRSNNCMNPHLCERFPLMIARRRYV